MSKVPTYIFQNILFILLSVPPLAMLNAGIVTLTSIKLPSGWMLPVAIACTIPFIVAGTTLSMRYARKVRHMTNSGHGEEGLKFAKKVNKYFFGILVITWILGILTVIYVPSYAAYRSRGYDIMSKNDLKNFYIAAEKYFQNNPNGTIDVETAKQYGFKPSPGVKLEIRKGQQMNFIATTSHPIGIKMYVINSEGEIVEQKIPDR